jgi:hypothetical protein
VNEETGRLEVGMGTPFTTSPILSNPSWKGGNSLPPVGNWDNGVIAAKSLREESYLQKMDISHLRHHNVSRQWAGLCLGSGQACMCWDV